MKIKKLGFSHYKITLGDLAIETDPQVDPKAKKVASNVVLSTSDKSMDAIKIDEDTRIITNPGEYELGGVIIHRPMDTDFYMMYHSGIRLLYAGLLRRDTNTEAFSEIGTIDILMLPVGASENMPTYETLAKIVSHVDPQVLIPIAHNDEGALPTEYADAKGVEEYLKNAGYSVPERIDTFKYKSSAGDEQRQMEIVVFK